MSWENIPASFTSYVRESQDGGSGLAIIKFIYSVLYEKQFGFQRNNSTEHVILHLTRDITGCFENGKYTLWVYIDFSEAFDLKCFTIKYFQYSVFFYFKSFCISQYFYPQNKNQDLFLVSCLCNSIFCKFQISAASIPVQLHWGQVWNIL